MTISPEQRQTLERLWSEGLSRAAVAEAVGITPRQLDQLAADGLANLPRRRKGTGGGPSPFRDPSPTEIRRRCLAVQMKWTESEWVERTSGIRMLTDLDLKKPPPPGRSSEPLTFHTETGRLP